MKNTRLIIALTCFVFAASSCASSLKYRKATAEEKETIRQYRNTINTDDGTYHILMMTDKGNMVVKLYNETPLHRDNFVKLVRSGFYDNLLFHRVINEFMIQGGDPNSKNAKPDSALGSGGAPGGRIPAEFRTEQHIYHKRGALAAARDNNAEKASSNSQFYIVQRNTWRVSQLDSSAAARGFTLNPVQKRVYTTIGGTPHLDGNYTVFGELEIGFDVLDSIATIKTGERDRPVEDIRMRMFLLNKRR